MQNIKTKYHREPLHIFVSGRYPPHIEKKSTTLYRLSDSAFSNAILKMGGTPKIIFEHEELSQWYIPILRADYKLAEQYKWDHDLIQFDCGITAFSGKEDPVVSRSEIAQWQRYTTSPCSFYEFAGGHFFIHDHFKEITQIISKTLSSF